MTTAAILMQEIETLPEESVAEILDFALFLRTKKSNDKPKNLKIGSMYGIFPGINTNIERDEEDRV